MTIETDYWVDYEPVDINECLSDVCLAEVLHFLPFRERVKCERVCQKWRRNVLDINENKQSSLSIMGELITLNVIANFCTNPRHRIWKSTDILVRTDSMTDIMKVIRKVPNLKALHLRSDDFYPILQDGEADQIGRFLPKLEHFSLIDDFLGATILNESMLLLNTMPNLYHLELRFPVKEGDTKLEMRQENFLITDALELYKGHIEILSTNVPLNPDNCRTLSSQCGKMRKLSLVGTSLPVPGLNSFLNEGGVRGKYLRCLSIVVDSEEQLKLICDHMICLQSFHCVINVKNLRNVGSIGRLRNLKNLFISAWSNELLDEAMLKVFLGCQYLSSIIINGDVSDKSFKLMSGFCPCVKRIEINNGKRGDLITDESLVTLTRLKFLYSLNLYYCEVSDSAVKKLLDACKDLRYLRLTSNSSLTKDILETFINFAKNVPNNELVTFVLPDRLKRYWTGFVPRTIPKNIAMQWL
ncbi:hypothetical protein HDE_03542 [Halotydeus destructor]|nr:hypothetical protein HDE_03542 [Halotydeus destructor]